MDSIKKILTDQSGMQVLEAVGLAVIGLIFVGLIFNATKSGIDDTASKLGNTLEVMGNTEGLPDQINP